MMKLLDQRQNISINKNNHTPGGFVRISSNNNNQIPDCSVRYVDTDGPAHSERPMHPSIKPQLLRVREVVLITGFSRSKVYEMIADGTLPCVRHGKSVRVPAADLNEWILKQTNNSRN